MAYIPSGWSPLAMPLVALLRYPVPGDTKTPYAFWPLSVVGAAVALARLSYPFAAGPRNPPGGACVRWLPRPDWSQMIVVTQAGPAQNEALCAGSATTPRDERV